MESFTKHTVVLEAVLRQKERCFSCYEKEGIMPKRELKRMVEDVECPICHVITSVALGHNGSYPERFTCECGTVINCELGFFSPPQKNELILENRTEDEQRFCSSTTNLISRKVHANG